MWLKIKGKFHMLPSYEGIKDEAVSMLTLCNQMVVVEHKKQIKTSYILFEKHICQICYGVWTIVYTSISDAKHTVQKETNIKILRRASEITNAVTLKRMIEARIRKLEKTGIQQ